MTVPFGERAVLPDGRFVTTPWLQPGCYVGDTFWPGPVLIQPDACVTSDGHVWIVAKGHADLNLCRGKELDFVNRAIRVAVGEIKQLRLRVKPAAPEAARAQTWQPIETAPKDGSDVLLLCAHGYRVIGRWTTDVLGFGWMADYRGRIHPSHWMPLPAPPDGGRDQ